MASEPSGPKVGFIDTSQWRGAVNAAKVADSGKVGIWPRTTDRTTLDPYWHQTARDALAQGLVVAARHRIYGSPSVADQFGIFAREVEEVRAGAEGLLISLDSEDDASWGQVQEFEQRAFDRWGVWLVGYYPCWWLPRVGNPTIRASVTWWHSRYASSPGELCGGRTSLAGQCWQYTDKGSCPGVNPPVDLNWFYGTREELAAKAVGAGGVEVAEATDALRAVLFGEYVPGDAKGGSMGSKQVDVQGGVDRMEPRLGQVPTASQIAAEVLAQLGLPPQQGARRE